MKFVAPSWGYFLTCFIFWVLFLKDPPLKSLNYCKSMPAHESESTYQLSHLNWEISSLICAFYWNCTSTIQTRSLKWTRGCLVLHAKSFSLCTGRVCPLRPLWADHLQKKAAKCCGLVAPKRVGRDQFSFQNICLFSAGGGKGFSFTSWGFYLVILYLVLLNFNPAKKPFFK